MVLLALDTSTDYLSLALMKEGKVIGRFHKKSSMRHSSLMMPALDRLLKKAGVKIGDIDCFCVSVGPGSFTGLRIGVTAIKGLAYALNKPIVAVPTLDVIAQNAKNFKGIVCPVLDARKNKVYACIYSSDGKKIKRLSGYLLIPASDLLKKVSRYGKIIFLGDAVTKLPQFFSKEGQDPFSKWHPRAEVAAIMGAEDFKKKRFVKPRNLEPLYLYSKECDITGK